MAAILAEHLQTVLDSALTGLEMDQSGNAFAALLTYRSALSCLTYCTDSLLSEQHPMVWLEACRQVQAVLEDRIQARECLHLTARLRFCHVLLHMHVEEHHPRLTVTTPYLSQQLITHPSASSSAHARKVQLQHVD